MQPITLEYSADILAGIGMTAMPSLFAMGDKLAHVLRVRLKAGGKPVDLTGWTVTASVVRQDQATVMMAGRAVGDGRGDAGGALLQPKWRVYAVRGHRQGAADHHDFLWQGRRDAHPDGFARRSRTHHSFGG